MALLFPIRLGNAGTTGGFRGVFMRQIGGLGAPAATSGGFRSVFKAQIGGLGSPSVAPVPPPAGVDSGGIGSGQFSRGQWHRLKKRWREEDEILARAAEAQGREREALQRAAAETAKARAEADDQYQGELIRLQHALAGAAGATTVAKAISQANEAVRIAKAIQAETEEEEEAIALLLMH